jgi:2-octaprenyl-6-methoxyphenol hydroxylase
MSEALRYDIAVVGGGLAGLAATLSAVRTGLSVFHVAPKAPPDLRTSALMMPTVAYMQQAHLIDDASEVGVPLTQIRIIDATHRLIRAPETLFDSAEAGLPAFGWNFANSRLNAAFSAALAGHKNLTTIESTLASLDLEDDGASLTLGNGQKVVADLLVGADGKKSLIREEGGFRARETGLEEAALVCDLTLDRPLGGTSVEFHYDRGPFTLVPAGGNKANLVWIDDRNVLTAARDSDAEGLRAAIQAKSQNLFGSIAVTTPAFVFPLSTLSVDRAGIGKVVLVGESAHAFPPIGAQGLNLGLRDVSDLELALKSARHGAANWANTVAEDYARRRAPDLARTGGMVDALFRSLLSDFIPMQSLRAGGLWALKLLPPLRKQAFQLGMGAR